jgi:FixJ family two-component response regulator
MWALEHFRHRKRYSFAAARDFLRRLLGAECQRESKPPLISIVDDDHAVREAIKSLIRSVGLRAETYVSTEEFVQCNHLGEVACLIVDVHLPGKSGLELQRELATGTYDIPVVFITADGNDTMRNQALKDGALAFLLKPFSEESLLSALQAALKQ